MDSLLMMSPGSINITGADHGESNLDLQYSMSLVTKGQQVTLFQTGDAIESTSSLALFTSTAASR